MLGGQSQNEIPWKALSANLEEKTKLSKSHESISYEFASVGSNQQTGQPIDYNISVTNSQDHPAYAYRRSASSSSTALELIPFWKWSNNWGELGCNS